MILCSGIPILLCLFSSLRIVLSRAIILRVRLPPGFPDEPPPPPVLLVLLLGNGSMPEELMSPTVPRSYLHNKNTSIILVRNSKIMTTKHTTAVSQFLSMFVSQLQNPPCWSQDAFSSFLQLAIPNATVKMVPSRNAGNPRYAKTHREQTYETIINKSL